VRARLACVFSTVCLSHRLSAYVTKIKTESKKKAPNGVHRLRSEKKFPPHPSSHCISGEATHFPPNNFFL
jgi:hypothetical protein